MTEKLRNSYKTISEVVKILNINSSNKKANQSHTIRYWESQFKQIKPKIINKRRYYCNLGLFIFYKHKHHITSTFPSIHNSTLVLQIHTSKVTCIITTLC